MMRQPVLRLFFLAAAVAFCSNPGACQSAAAAKGKVERIQVHARSLEGNLSGDPPLRDVSVYLPPSYQQEAKRRYPVIYFLHGFTDSDDKWYGFTKHWINLPEVLDQARAAGAAADFIFVTPNAFTTFYGSMYSHSVTIGNWEEFIARELVSHIDRRYRTLAHAAHRGLAGHSMGGYGALRIGMKNPAVFSALYLLSPCCLIPAADPERIAALGPKLEAVKSPADVAQADFFTKAMLASAAAWSPNPRRPPLYLDLPWQEGAFQPRVLARWTANAPLALLDQFIVPLKQLQGLAFDAGTRDRPIVDTIKDLHEALEIYGVPHIYETYDGDHLNRIAERIQTRMLPFFAARLAPEKKR